MDMHRQGKDRAQSEMAQVVERNITALLEKRRTEERQKPLDERLADAVTGFAGSMRFVYIHIALYGLWLIVNMGWLPPLSPFDPEFVKLAMVASVEAIFLSTFILISQNRMTALADKRADLDLQISLLSEHEVTRLIRLVDEIAHKLGIDEAKSPELAELKKDVAPEAVLDKMEKTAQKFEEEKKSKEEEKEKR